MNDIEKIQWCAGHAFLVGLVFLVIHILLSRAGSADSALGFLPLTNCLYLAIFLIVVGGLSWLTIELEWHEMPDLPVPGE